MNCACELDGDGKVSNACAAHVDWYRRTAFNSCSMPYHKALPMIEADLKFQKKASEVLLSLLVEKLARPEVDES